MINGIELGSTGKNMEACFGIYRKLSFSGDAPAYIPSYRRTEQIYLYQIFPHTRVGARRTGGFRVTEEDISEKIEKALDYLAKVENNESEKLFKVYDLTDYDDDDDYSDYPDTINGYAGKMHHVGYGAYCDDDGDNWDFL